MVYLPIFYHQCMVNARKKSVNMNIYIQIPYINPVGLSDGLLQIG